VRNGFLTVQRLKGSLKTTQALVESADPLMDEKSALIEYARKSIPGRPVFDISRVHFWRLVRKYAEAAGIPEHKAHPHALKHSIAMQTIHLAGVENVRQYLGHKSLSSTGEYLRVSDEAASAAIAKALKD
jgi:site-specific recombinase XerD